MLRRFSSSKSIAKKDLKPVVYDEKFELCQGLFLKLLEDKYLKYINGYNLEDGTKPYITITRQDFWQICDNYKEYGNWQDFNKNQFKNAYESLETNNKSYSGISVLIDGKREFIRNQYKINPKALAFYLAENCGLKEEETLKIFAKASNEQSPQIAHKLVMDSLEKPIEINFKTIKNQEESPYQEIPNLEEMQKNLNKFMHKSIKDEALKMQQNSISNIKDEKYGRE